MSDVLEINGERQEGDWEGARRAWLEGQGRVQTRRGYELALEGLLGFVGRPAGEVTVEQVGEWVEQMKRQGVKGSTIRYRLGAASSFYRFASERLGLAGRVNPAAEWREAGGQARSRGVRRWLSREEAAKLLSVVDVETLWGRRDYALFLTCLRSGRRVTEAVGLRWGDIEAGEEGAWYWWEGTGRGGEERRRSRLDAEAWEAIREYLRQAGRLEGMQAEDFIFTPLSDPGGRLVKLYGEGWQRRPLGVNVIERDLRRYADFAGLGKKRVSPMTLRYTAAWLRLEAGATVDEVGELLGFCERDVTAAFLKRMGWKKTTKGAKSAKDTKEAQASEAKPLVLEGEGGETRFQRWKRGAPRRNQNALRHGLHARYFEPSEEEWQEAWRFGSPTWEIALTRIKLGRLFGYASKIKDVKRAVRLYGQFGKGCMRVAKMFVRLAESQGVKVKRIRWERELKKARRKKRNAFEEQPGGDLERLMELAQKWEEEEGEGLEGQG